MSFAFRLVLALSFAIVGASCTQNENLFNTGRDARVYNPMTGRYEWPDRH